MEAIRRGVNGKRLFTPEFKREQVGRVVRGEVSAAELGRELGISPSLVRRWKHLADSGARMAVNTNEDLVPLSELRTAQQRIRELKRALGRKTMENEILLAAQTEEKKTQLLRRVATGDCQTMSGHPVAVICRTLGVGRSTADRPHHERGPYDVRREDAEVAERIRTILRERYSYGHKRVTTLVNRRFGTRYNRKRIRRVMALCDRTLPPRARRRTGRPHRGRIRRDAANERWCSDTLELRCWNGECVVVAFALDCHDRECLAWVAEARTLCAANIQQLMRAAVAARSPEGGAAPEVQWLSDNGSIYTALTTYGKRSDWGCVQ